MGHNRKIVLSLISMTKARPNRHTIPVAEEVMDIVEKLMIDNNFLDSAPFAWVGLSIRSGLQNDEAPIYQGINKKYGDLSVAIEVDTHNLIDADREHLKQMFIDTTLQVLEHIGKKYKLPTESLENYRAEH